MSRLDRVVAGIRCRDVLDWLSDYLDGELDPKRVRQVDAHLAGCDRCERFGGEFSQVVASIRRTLGPAGPLDPEVAAGLERRLAAETGDGDGGRED